MPAPRRALVGLAAVAVVALAPAAGHADPKSHAQAEQTRVSEDIADLQDDLAGTSTELTAAYAQLSSAQQRLPGAQAALDAALADQAEAERHDETMAGRLKDAEQALAQAQDQVAAGQEQLDLNRAQIGRMASAAYRNGSVSGELDVVLGAQSPQHFADRYLLAGSVLTSRSATVGRLGESQSLHRRASDRLAAVEAEVAELRQQARQALRRAQEARRRAAQAKTALDQVVTDKTAAVKAITARKAEEDARLAELKAELTGIEATLKKIADQERAERERQARQRRAKRPAAPAEPVSGGGGGALTRPVDTRVTSRYGYRIHPIYGYRRMHSGTDFGGPCGTPVRAAADGRVVSSGWAGGYGKRVVVSHAVVGGQSVATTYNHLSSISRGSGSVSRGEVIGLVGTTGASTGCHLHFEVFVNGSHTDPMGWL